jgi:hypothetical protein
VVEYAPQFGKQVENFCCISCSDFLVVPSARVVKLVDTRDLKSLGLTAVPVRFRSRAPSLSFLLVCERLLDHPKSFFSRRTITLSNIPSSFRSIWPRSDFWRGCHGFKINSRASRKAWRKIAGNPEVTLSLPFDFLTNKASDIPFS